ncbi:MAG: xanthine dehydrogenase family protein molybdopterin-binding subunit [Fimbriimonadaceae bacterium]|nr:xanthine dehydrogenase family protein molybdopterin-binding subunit [Alphaproteobacteria bacterium]
MSELSYVGKSWKRKDGPDKVTGKAVYSQDVNLPGMLTGKILRSPHPHAKIVRIDTSKARALPGVKCVITIDDTKGIKHGFVETPRYPPDQEVLARGKVVHVGEEVAAVAATSPMIADQAIGLIDIEYEILPAIFHPRNAMKPDAIEIQPTHPKVKEQEPFANIAGKTETGWGDVEKGFAEAHYVRKDRFESHLRTHGYLEPQVTLAHWENDKLDVWTSSMGTFVKRSKLAKVLDLPFSSVRIHKTYTGGTFGGKIDLYSHEYCASRMSMMTRRPVRIVASREEIFSAYRHGQPLTVELKTGVDKDGVLIAQEIKVINNAGAHRGSGVVVVFLCWGFTMAPYRLPNLKYEGYSVYTNYTTRAPQRGHGCPQIRFAIESQLDMIAEEIGIDPVTIRLNNARDPGEDLPNRDNVHQAGLKDCIRLAAEKTDFLKHYGQARKSPDKTSSKRRGWGIGLSSYFTGSLIYPNGSGVMVKMNDDGSAVVLTGALDVGQGAETIITQIVAEELSIGMDDIKLVTSDTDTTPQDIGAWISGMTYVTGNASRQAAGNAREKLLLVAAEQMNTTTNDLRLENKTVISISNPDNRLSYREVIAASVATHRGDTIIGEGFWRTMRDEPTHPSLASTKGRWSENYAFSVQIAEVEVDIETGEAKLIKALTVHDCGFPVNPALVKGQVDGQVSMALGHAFMEEIITRNGYTLNTNWLDYRMPTIHNMAISEDADVITEQYTVGQPYRTKEVGEGLVSAILAAMGNAVYDATGVRLHSTPFTPAKILKGLQAIEANKEN